MKYHGFLSVFYRNHNRVGDVYDERSYIAIMKRKAGKNMKELKITYGADVAQIIESLYYGEISPCEEQGALSEKMKAAERELAAVTDKLMKANPGLNELWEEWQEMQSVLDSLYAVNEFGKGLALGIRLMLVGKDGS